MISLMSFDHPHVPPGAAEDEFANWLLNMAEFRGWQDDGKGGSFQLWNLRKSLYGHPKGDTLSRATLERIWRSRSVAVQPKYGSTQVNTQDPALGAVESP